MQSDILIIGAGMTGLMAAQQLAGSKQTVTLVDKGRSVGGRLATRRLAAGRADHGAQFFTARDSDFQAYVNAWQRSGLIYEWSRGWSDGSLNPNGADGFPRYAARDGMNGLAKALAAELSAASNVRIVTDVRIAAVRHEGRRWLAGADDGRQFEAGTLVMTAPVPQSIDLLARGGITLPEICQRELGPLAYAPCLCGLYRVEGEVTLPEPGAIQRPRAEISWMADNQRKGISPDATVITIHAGPEFSRTYYDAPDAEVEPHLRAALIPYLGEGAIIAEAQVKRWRYALPLVLYPQRYLKALDLPSLYFGGDAFGGPRVEGAALSGITIGRMLAEGE
jgi:predicted NAD/FAD-dependent oxidoreductase